MLLTCTEHKQYRYMVGHCIEYGIHMKYLFLERNLQRMEKSRRSLSSPFPLPAMHFQWFGRQPTPQSPQPIYLVTLHV